MLCTLSSLQTTHLGKAGRAPLTPSLRLWVGPFQTAWAMASALPSQLFVISRDVGLVLSAVQGWQGQLSKSLGAGGAHCWGGGET